jgi:hypothetical protein
MFRAKLSDTKQCPSCGWIMRLQVDPDERAPQADTPDLSVVRFFQCTNRACEHCERADRAA